MRAREKVREREMLTVEVVKSKGYQIVDDWMSMWRLDVQLINWMALIARQELSDMTAIKAEDILSTLQGLELIQYRKGQHVICADPKVLDRHLKAAGRGGLEVDVCKLIWTPYKEQS